MVYVSGVMHSLFNFTIAVETFLAVCSANAQSRSSPLPISGPAFETPSLAKAAEAPANGSKEKPFVNSLGLAFVPIPNTGVLMCRTGIRVKDFRRFVDETGHRPPTGAIVMKVQKDSRINNVIAWELDPTATWEDPGFPQKGDYPVVAVSWNVAKEFCDWLS